MPSLNIMSWNIESVSESSMLFRVGTQAYSLAAIAAEMIMELDIDLLLVMEVSPNSASVIAPAFAAAFNALQEALPGNNKTWVYWASDPTSKDLELPDRIDVKRQFPKSCDKNSYWKTLSIAYQQESDMNGTDLWVLNPARDKSQDWQSRDSLLLCGILRNDKEVYLSFFRCDQSANFTGKYWNSTRGVGAQPGFGGLRSANAAGLQLGYQDPGCVYNGRSPFLIQLFTGSPLIPNYFPVLLFHAPFGGSVQPRVTANNNLASIGIHSGSGSGTLVNLMDAPLAIVCGDLNVDYDLSDYSGITLPIPASANASRRTYGYFVATQFRLGIAELSTLKAMNSVDPSWTDPTQYRSAAYDNIVVRTSATGNITGSHVVDMIASLSNPVTSQPLIGSTFMSTNSVYKAFEFYRTNVSDHLPAVANITLNI